MKISKFAIVSAVAFLHIAAISLMIVQPGCNGPKTTGKPEGVPVPAVAANANANADVTLPAPPASPAFVPPTRPEPLVVPVTIATLNSGESPAPGGINAITPVASVNAPTPEVTYVVKSKDSLASIAKANGVNLKDLEAANPKVVPTKMKVGDTLTIPMGSASTPATGAASTADTSAGLRTHKVVSGEVLATIARKEGTTVAALKAENNLKSDNIRVGQDLKIPADANAAGTSSRTASAGSGASGSSAATAGPGEYIVKSGDSLDAIAKKFGVKIADLMTLNNISNPLGLPIGKRLKLPPNAKTPAAPASAPADTAPAVASPAPAASAFVPLSPSSPASVPAPASTDVAPVAVPVSP